MGDNDQNTDDGEELDFDKTMILETPYKGEVPAKDKNSNSESSD